MNCLIIVHWIKEFTTIFKRLIVQRHMDLKEVHFTIFIKQEIR